MVAATWESKDHWLQDDSQCNSVPPLDRTGHKDIQGRFCPILILYNRPTLCTASSVGPWIQRTSHHYFIIAGIFLSTKEQSINIYKSIIKKSHWNFEFHHILSFPSTFCSNLFPFHSATKGSPRPHEDVPPHLQPPIPPDVPSHWTRASHLGWKPRGEDNDDFMKALRYVAFGDIDLILKKWRLETWSY